jgi:transcriptional regulator with XRE-family HTH domain
MTGYHTRWARHQDAADDPERIAIREALAFGKALYDIRTALGLSVAELAVRTAMTGDDIERIEEGGTEPTIPLLRRLAAALNADVRLTGGHDLGSVWFETHAALPASVEHRKRGFGARLILLPALNSPRGTRSCPGDMMTDWVSPACGGCGRSV